MKKYADLITEKTHSIFWIKFNRPQQRNAISSEMIESFVAALSEAEMDDSVRVIILAGEGENFSAGGDVKDMKSKSGMFAGEANELRLRYRNGIQKIPEAINRLNKPLIGMVHGAAVGAGCDIVSMCDYVVAEEKATFAETFSKIALVPGDGGTFFLQRAIGFRKAMEMYLTGDFYSATQALAMGLINKVTSKENLKAETIKVADKISQNSPIAIQMTKRALVHAYRSDLNSNLDLLSAFQAITQRTTDHAEGLKALQQKEKPNFQGR
ncbi:MAG: enoyl-CoA hydratase/isomerase family protein [Bacteriovoracaceae bacterium]|nr:enoyl-CoA hydratase/isomerase family protein [Bacteriovoracaceae bacterium]